MTDSPRPYLLFDAGGVLLFPDAARLADLAARRGLALDPGALLRECFRFSFEFDCHVRARRAWRHENLLSFLRGVFGACGVGADCCEELVGLAEACDRDSSLWLKTEPWVRPVLEELRRLGYPMSVISNADGRVERMLEELGLREFFECVSDSHVLGVQKPDPRIFDRTLERLGLHPDQAIFLGDIYHVDVWGANRAGIDAIHLDPFGFYAGWPGARLRDLRQLPEWLAAHGSAWNAGHGAAAANGSDLFPLKAFCLTETQD